MKYFHPAPLTINEKVLMNRPGYQQKYSRRSGEISYIRRIGRSLYPRYHVYIQVQDKGIVFNAHLDEKQASYHGYTAHSGQYDTEKIHTEVERIKSFLEQL